MAVRVRRKVIRRPRDDKDNVAEEKVSKRPVVKEEETGDELDEVPKQIKKLAENPDDDAGIPEVFRRPPKKVVVPPPVNRKAEIMTSASAKAKQREVLEQDKLSVEKDAEEELPVERLPLSVERLTSDYQTKTVNDVVTDNLFGALLGVLQTGGEIIITKLAENKWNLKMNSIKPRKEPTVEVETHYNEEKKVITYNAPKNHKVTTKLTGKEYEQEVCTQEYLDFVEEWRGMDITEKRKYAKSLGCKWEKAADVKIENMAISRAVQEAKDITKYKPKYQSGKARAAVKG